MLNKTRYLHSAKKCFDRSLFILGLSILLSACAGSRNAPRSMFVSSQKHIACKVPLLKDKEDKNSVHSINIEDKSLSSDIIYSSQQLNAAFYTKIKNDDKFISKKIRSKHTSVKINNRFIKTLLSKNIVKNKSKANTKSDTNRKVEPNALCAFIFSLFCIAFTIYFVVSLSPLVTLAFLFAILATIFGFISLSKIKKNPDTYNGKGFAVSGLIIGIVFLASLLLLIGIYFYFSNSGP